MMGMRSGEGAEPPPSIMKFENTRISTESKTFYPYEKCRTHVNKKIFGRHSLRNNNHPASVFPTGANFVQVSPPVVQMTIWAQIIGAVISETCCSTKLISFTAAGSRIDSGR